MFTTVLFYILAIILVIAALRVITVKSPVVAVLHLILAFVTASLLWMLIGAEFLSLLLIVVYVGAVMILFLFVVMMIDIQPDNLRAGFKTYLPIGLIVGLVMVAEIAFVFANIYYGSGAPIAIPDGYNNTLELGKVMYGEYSYAIQVAAVLLLVGMVAAIALTLRTRTNKKFVSVSEQLKVKSTDRLRIVKMASEPKSEPTKNEGEA